MYTYYLLPGSVVFTCRTLIKMCFQINEFVKRARAAKIHAYIISHLKREMPSFMGKSKTQKRLMDNLEDVFAKVSLSLSCTNQPRGTFLLECCKFNFF